MVWLRLFALVRHFYFNYNYVDSNVPYIHSLSSRRIQFSIRMVVAFLFGGFIAYGTSLRTQVPQPFLLPLLTVLSIQDTVGLTVAAAVQMLIGLVPTSIFIYICQRIGLGYHDYAAAECILLILSFFIGFAVSQVQTRKIPLVIIAITFSTLVNQPKVPLTFIFLLLEEIIIAVCISILVSLIVLPSFATMDIENRVNYGLVNLEKMYMFIVQAFLREDQMDAQALLARASTTEQMILEAIGRIQTKLVYARFEPSKLLQWIFNQRRRKIFHLTLQEQENLVTSLYLHVRSMQSIVKQCQFNEYHTDLTRDVRKSLLHLSSLQSIIINNITKPPSITKDEFMHYLSDLNQARYDLSKMYRNSGLFRLEYALISRTNIRSQDHLSHACFLFQIHSIVRLLTEALTTQGKKVVEEKKKKSLKERLIPKWSRVQVALKTTVIMGIGSIFIMEPTLVRVFENGQWIFVALCMTQGDTVGGAFVTMQMRLFGTLLGAVWAYITFLAVGDHVYRTFGMLVPWILFFGYIRSLPNWTYTAMVAIFTPILINLGRLAYIIPVPEANFILLRIEENVIGIGLAIVLTLIILPVFALDLLKKNVQKTLEDFHDSVNSIRSIYKKISIDEKTNEISLTMEKDKEIKSFFATQRKNMYLYITNQRTHIEHTAVEPTFIWINNFSSKHYTTLLEQEIDICELLHTIDAALMMINEHVSINEQKTHFIGEEFFQQFRKELFNVTYQLSVYFDLWSAYFKLSQSRYHRLLTNGIYYKKELFKIEVLKQDTYLAELSQTAHRLENEHQHSINRILRYFFGLVTKGDTPSTFIPYSKTDQNEMILIAISTMYYSTVQLVRTAITLGTTVHTIFELETTHQFTRY